MRPALRLAINSLWARKAHAALLIAAVALSCALVVTVAILIRSVNQSVRLRMEGAVGDADLRLESATSNGLIPELSVHQILAWPEVERATPVLQRPISLRVTLAELVADESGIYRPHERTIRVSPLGWGLDADRLSAIQLVTGRLPAADDEIVVDALLAERLSIAGEAARSSTASRGLARVPPPREGQTRPPLPPQTSDDALASRLNAAQRSLPGDVIEATRLLRAPVPLRIVGVAPQPPLGGRPQAYLTRQGLAKLADAEGRVTSIDIVLKEGVEADAVSAAHRTELPDSQLLKTTAKVTSGLDKNLRSSELGLVLAIVLSTLSASFIILTGLTTDLARRQRELAVLRCIGASRAQLGVAQLWSGLIVGFLGAIIGTAIGFTIAWSVAAIRPDALAAGMQVPARGVSLGVAGAMLSGLLGSAWPAWRVSRISPLEGLTLRARPTAAHVGRWLSLTALILICYGFLTVSLPHDGQTVFWAYAISGLPLIFIGYFLLGTPLILMVSRALSPAVSRALHLPPSVLDRSIRATPYRHGLTAGALMTGVSIMTVIWTNGGAVMRDWLDKLQFPDAFVSGLALPEAAENRIRELPCVTDTCAIGLHFIETDAFGVRALQSYMTSFIAFEPEPFFRMAHLEWVQGSLETALPKLERGGAVIVAREFLIAQGLGVGDEFVCRDQGNEFRFEIVGVVTSPGLEVVSKFFNISEDYTNQSLHAVFGTRADMKRLFNNESIQLIQIGLHPDWNDDVAMEQIRETLAGIAVLDSGSGRRIRDEIRSYVSSAITIMTAIALFAMITCSFGVANLVIASIEGRRFEFGILRAVGAHRGLLVRLVVAEVLLVAVTGAFIGTVLGIQAAWSEQRLMRLLLGLGVQFRLPLVPIAGAWAMLILTCLCAAAPAMWRLGRREPRELLAAARA